MQLYAARTVQTESNQACLNCRGAARSRTLRVQSYDIFLNLHQIGLLFCEFLVRKFVDSEFIRIFAPTESATLPIEQRTRAGLLFCSIMSNIYTKQPLSIDDQIAKIRSQGLIITEMQWHFMSLTTN